MPYASVKDLPPAVRRKIKSPKRRRQWMHVWNSEYTSHGDESRAFASAWSTAQKRLESKYSKTEVDYQYTPSEGRRCGLCTMFVPPDECTAVQGQISKSGFCKLFRRKNTMNKSATAEAFNFFLPITKIDKNARTISGYASTPTLDLDGEIVSIDAVRKALPGYWEWRNIREMHGPSAVGVAKEANVDDKGLFLTAKIVDEAAWQKVLEGVYKGYSIGGKKLAKTGNTITDIELVEVSVVDRPANPDCRFSVAKKAKDAGEAFLLKAAKSQKDMLSKALLKMAEVSEFLAKAGDNPPAAQDGFSLPAKTACKAHGVMDCKVCAEKDVGTAYPSLADQVAMRTKKRAKPKVKKREVSDKERQSLASRGQALPGGGFPIKNKEDLMNARHAIGRAKNPSAARALIRRRARELGVKLPSTWSKKFARDLLAKAELLVSASALTIESSSAQPPFLSLKKTRTNSSSSAGDGVLETGSRKLSLGSKDGGAEGSFLNLGKGSKMAKNGKNAAVGLDEALLNMLKRASEPDASARLQMARSELKKARDARKEAAAAIKAAHSMHKAAYLAKQAQAALVKAGKKPADDGDADDFDHEAAMQKLSKAYGELEKVSTFTKAAREQLAKVSRATQGGQQPSDGEGSFYTPPAGVRDISPDEMAGAKPGTAGSGGLPPDHRLSDGPYPGKAAKKGQFVTQEVVDLMLKNAKLEARNEILENMPARQGRHSPSGFDLGKLGGANASGGVDPLWKAVKDSGVDPRMLESENEDVRKRAGATVAGTYLMTPGSGKSIFSTDFHGAAGGRQ